MKYTVSFRNGTRAEYTDVAEARKAYFEELAHIERGPYIPELYKHNAAGIITHRINTVWTEIMQPTEISEQLNTRPGTEIPDTELQLCKKHGRESGVILNNLKKSDIVAFRCKKEGHEAEWYTGQVSHVSAGSIMIYVNMPVAPQWGSDNDFTVAFLNDIDMIVLLQS